MSRHFGTDVADDLGDNFPKCGESSEEEPEKEKIAFRLAICKDGSRCFMPVKTAVTSGRFSIGMVAWIVVAVLAAISLVCCSISCATRRSSAVTTRSLASESIVANDTVVTTKALSEPVEFAVSDSNSVNTDINGKNESVAGALDALVTEKTEGSTNHGV